MLHIASRGNLSKEPLMENTAIGTEVMSVIPVVPDPLKGNHRKRRVNDMPFASVISVICGFNSYRCFERFVSINIRSTLRGHWYWYSPSHTARLQTCTFAHLGKRRPAWKRGPPFRGWTQFQISQPRPEFRPSASFRSIGNFCVLRYIFTFRRYGVRIFRVKNPGVFTHFFGKTVTSWRLRDVAAGRRSPRQGGHPSRVRRRGPGRHSGS